jgi:hypothetical protein
MFIVLQNVVFLYLVFTDAQKSHLVQIHFPSTLVTRIIPKTQYSIERKKECFVSSAAVVHNEPASQQSL